MPSRMRYFARILRYLLIALAVIFFAIVLSFLLSWNHWQRFSREAISGKNYLSSGLDDFRAKNWQQAETKMAEAKKSFIASGEAIVSLRSFWFPARFGLGRSQLDDLQHLNDTGLIIASSAGQIAGLAENLDLSAIGSGRFKDLGPEKKAEVLQSLIALEPELNGLKANLNLAIYNIDQIHRVGLLWPIRGKLIDARNRLAEGEILLSQAIPILRLIPSFTGYPKEAHYLIMLQNNDELRPTGGFLGSYVRIDIADFGEIRKMVADDIYHLDMPSIGKVSYDAPKPISDYLKVEKLYLRDSNWSPDWPQSARLINEMFSAESIAAGQTEPPLDGILAITPDFVASLLRLTGPIIVRGETYAPENMQALLQYNVEIAYKEDDISSWDRKEIINELIGALKEKLMDLPIDRYPELADTITRNISRRDLLLYFNDPGRQSVAASLGADGGIKQTAGDYLMVVDANLAAFKSDAVMGKNISYQLTENDGLTASVALDYRHDGGFDWRTTRYRSYTRIFAPLGSEVIGIEGLNKEETDVASYDDPGLGKHVIGFFWSIEPGQARRLRINYRLPEEINRRLQTEKLYTLYIQRQPGSRIENLNVSIDPQHPIIKASPASGNIGDRTSWKGNLEQDANFQILTE